MTSSIKWRPVKETKLLLRQRFNNKIGYTLCSKTILFNWYLQYRVVKIHRPTLLTAQTFNCNDMRFRPVLDTHSLTQAYTYSADRAIFPWQQRYSSFLTSSCFSVFSFHSLWSLHPGRHWLAYRLLLMLASRNLQNSNVQVYEYH